MAEQKNYFGKGDIRPHLPGIKKPANPANPFSKTTDPLKSAENDAARPLSSKTSESRLSNSLVKSLEKSPKISPRVPSLYAGTGKRRGFGRPKKSLKSRLLRSTPLLAFVIILIVGIGIIIGASSLLGPHLSALFTEATNTDYTAYNLRSNELVVEILQGKMAMPDYFKERLEKQGITVVNSQTLEYQGRSITADNFIANYNGDVYFREAIDDARRGRAATFFDDTAKNFYQKLGLSRDVLHDYHTTGNEQTDQASYDQLMTSYYDVEAGSTINTAYRETTTDDQGNTVTEIVPYGEGSVSSGGKTVSSEAKTRAKEYLDSVGNKVEATTPACAALEIGDMVATAVASNAKYTYANTYMTSMESISKTMAGDGDNSGIHSVLNWFTKTDTATVYDSVTGEEITVTGSPLEAQSVRAVLSDLPIDQSKTRKYSLERSFESTDVSIANAGLTTAGCAVERAGGVVLSLVAMAIPGASFVRTTIGILLDVAVGTGVKIVASSILGLLVPSIAQIMYTNSYTAAVGVAGGEEFGMGAANINQLAAQQNSAATGASKAAVLAYNRANNLTIAQQAEIDRKNYSPFDASNKNTFFGSIASSLLPLATTTSSLFSPISTIASLSGTSLASLNPTYADGENTSYLTNFGSYCNKVEEIGAVGNVFCNMIAVNDLENINTAEDDPAYRAVISQSVDIVDGKEVVRDNSPLANFINYWMGRYSMPGIYDANIAHACEEQIAGNFPIISDIVLMVKSINSDYCKRIADGSRYINSGDNPDWETEKYHQLWALTVRAKENLGFYKDDKNPLTAYREHYEAEHPLDNSHSGYLARISGLTKDDAETVLALFDYYQDLAEYNPDNTYQFSQTNPDKLHFNAELDNEYITNKKYYTENRREVLTV